MHISLPHLSFDGQSAKLSFSVSYASEKRVAWFSIPAEHADWFSTDRSDGILVGLLLQAMELNEDVELEGPVSSLLIHNIRNFFIPMMSQAFPKRHHIKVTSGGLIDEFANGDSVCSGFSGGIDSFASIIQHFVNESSEKYRITHLLFNNVGSHGSEEPERGRKFFNERYWSLCSFASEVGLPFVKVDSNLSEICDIDFITMHSALNAAVPLLLQNKFHRHYYASAFRYADCSVTATSDLAYFDPFALHLLSTDSLECISTGCQMSRVEKTKLVSEYEPSYRYLNVCVDPAFEGRNCSVCFKCARTIFTLETLGVAHFYHDVFDFEKFRRTRLRFMKSLFGRKIGPFDFEIAELYYTLNRGPFAGALKLRHLLR